MDVFIPSVSHLRSSLIIFYTTDKSAKTACLYCGASRKVVKLEPLI